MEIIFFKFWIFNYKYWENHFLIIQQNVIFLIIKRILISAHHFLSKVFIKNDDFSVQIILNLKICNSLKIHDFKILHVINYSIVPNIEQNHWHFLDI